jgi:uracil-DNA glycosylase
MPADLDETHLQTKVLGDPACVRLRASRLDEPHVRPLTALVERMRRQARRPDVPWFDPDSAGVHASVLLLLEAPGRRAAGTASSRGSGFVSPDNDDVTAHNLALALHEAGLDRSDVLVWNIVPWFIGSDTSVRAARSADLIEARPWLDELLALLTRLRVVVTLGRNAERGWQSYLASGGSSHDLVSLAGPHPSPKVLNTRRGARAAMVTALRDAAARIDSP